MKKHWLSIHPDTFLWVKNGIICVYNAKDRVFFKTPSSKELEKIVYDLLEIDNLYTTTITEKELKLPIVDNWIKKLIETNCCDWVANDGNSTKPISLKPMLKVTDNMEYYRYGHDKGHNANLLSNLHRLVIHLNASKYGNDVYAQQCIYPFREQKDLDLKELCNFIISSGTPIFLSEIILVGNLWEYKGYENLLDFLNRLSIKVSIYCTEQDYHNHIAKRKPLSLPEEYALYIMKEQYPKDDSCFSLLAAQKNLTWHFILTSEKEYVAANDLLEKYSIERYRLLPVYTGGNRTFFEDFIYTSENEILVYKPSKKEVFANQTLNTNYFGTLQILSGGDVSGGNTLVGSLKDSLYDVVYREMTEGDSWFRIRNQKPCCDCCYQWLCPSPSRYESVLKKPNLCNIVE